MSYYEPVLKFLDESKSFAHGFEGGRIYQALHDDPERQTFAVHGCNAELMLRIAEQFGRTIEWGDVDDTWATVTFSAEP